MSTKQSVTYWICRGWDSEYYFYKKRPSELNYDSGGWHQWNDTAEIPDRIAAIIFPDRLQLEECRGPVKVTFKRVPKKPKNAPARTNSYFWLAREVDDEGKPRPYINMYERKPRMELALSDMNSKATEWHDEHYLEELCDNWNHVIGLTPKSKEPIAVLVTVDFDA